MPRFKHRTMIVFFFRKSIDIDHMAPVIYKAVQDYGDSVLVLSLNPTFNFSGDYRLRFLMERHNVKVDYVYRAWTPTMMHRIVAAILCGVRSKGFGLRRLVRSIYYRFVNRWAYNRVFDDEWAAELIESMRAEALVFDWIKPYQFVAGSLLRAANRLGVPTISLPHGVSWVANELSSTDLAASGKSINYGEYYELFDHFVVQHPRFKEMVVKNGLPSEKVHVLGSSRFCDEWHQIHRNLVTDSDQLRRLDGDGKLKVVYMDSPPQRRMNVDAVTNSILRLSSLDFIEMLVIPHLRSNDLTASALGPSGRIVSNIPAVSLVKWADVVIGTSSSVLLEVFLQNKILLYPKYFHENTMIFEEYGACWSVSDYDELEAALKKADEDGAYKPYSDAEVRDLMTDLVYGGVEGRDVLGDHVRTIETAISDSKQKMIASTASD
mgnify:CR=1 FL=1